MDSAKRSPIQIAKLSLKSIHYASNGSLLRSATIELSAIRLTVNLSRVSELAIAGTCRIAIHAEESPEPEFQFVASYEFESELTDPALQQELENYSRFGAIFNVLAHARELLANLTVRTFGRAAILPLLDIRDFGSSLVVEGLKPSDQGSSESGTGSKDE